MKTHFKLLSVLALFLGSCTTGSMVTSGKYADDVYFTPGDNPPQAITTPAPAREERIAKSPVYSDKNQENAARVVDEYYGKNQGNDDNTNTYSLNNENPNETDSLYQGDEGNYDPYTEGDDSEELSYSTRIRSFYDPYMYDPFWDSSFGWGMGYGGLYGGFYGGFYSPWAYGGWGSPWYGYGYGYGYYPFNYYGGGFYGHHHGGGYGGGYYGNSRSRFYGRQNIAGTFGRGSNAINYGGNTMMRSGNIAGSPSRSYRSNAITAGTGANYSTRQAGTRYSVDPNLSARSARMGQQRNSETLMNLRRSGTRQNSMPATRSASFNQNSSQRYTPTYTRPRTNTQAIYNNGYRQQSTPSYSRSSAASRYAKPESNGSYQGRSSNYGATYQRRSATFNSGAGRSSGEYSAPRNSAPSRSFSGGGNYSAPSRSSFSGGGGGSYSGGGGGSFSGGGGGGGGRRR